MNHLKIFFLLCCLDFACRSMLQNHLSVLRKSPDGGFVVRN